MEFLIRAFDVLVLARLQILLKIGRCQAKVDELELVERVDGLVLSYADVVGLQVVVDVAYGMDLLKQRD